MTIPLPDGTRAHISHGDISRTEKLLGVWSTIDGNNSKHIEENIIVKTQRWINKMRNVHLPAHLGWVVYKFKLWAGIWCGISTLFIHVAATAKIVLHTENFHSRSFLGINQNMKKEWKTTHRAFRGIGLFSFAEKQMIKMINMFIQHYEAETTLARKLAASLEALQLEIGHIGNPLEENFEDLHLLATPCWVKSLWERIRYYKFKIHLAYPVLNLPR
jgi:hypothetical protein